MIYFVSLLSLTRFSFQFQTLIMQLGESALHERGSGDFWRKFSLSVFIRSLGGGGISVTLFFTYMGYFLTKVD